MSTSPARSGRRPLVAGLGLSLAAASLSVVAAAAPAQAADPVEVNILGINDFHGRINADETQAGAAVLAGAVEQIETEHPNTVFAAAGDLIGASTFESFSQKDKPTIDALNAAGLDVSAVGNHEFDQGYDDLVNRVMAPESAENPLGGAEWEYLGANVKVKETSDAPELEPSWIQTFNPGAENEVKVGFVGAVTEHLDELVSPTGIEDIEVTDIVEAVNTEADALKAQENVDLVVMLVHEGAPSTNCAAMDDDPTSDFGSIVTGVNANVDAVVSGHTHLAYDCKFDVQEWIDEGRAVTQRPVVSAGQYGVNLNQLTFTVDPDTGATTGLETAILPLVTESENDEGEEVYTPNYPADPAVQELVEDANAQAEVVGAEPLGQIADPFDRARRVVPDGDDEDSEPDLAENRGGESTLGNLVAEAQRWATEDPALGGAEIAFMNPGGLRADMRGNPNEDGSATVTLKQAAVVQPFANTLVNMTMTGAQIKTVLEQQWQPEGASRPFLRLGTSDGFEYSYDPNAPQGEHITGIWLDGAAVQADDTFSVTANSFLAAGGDNFTQFGEIEGRDTGQIDLDAMVAYMEAHATEQPLEVDRSQHSVGAVHVEEGLYLSSLAMTDGGVTDSEVEVLDGETSLGTFPVVSVVGQEPYDECGITFVPMPDGGLPETLTVRGASTGTEATVVVPALTTDADAAPRCTPLPAEPEPEPEPVTTIRAKVRPNRIFAKRSRPRVIVVVRTDGAPADGRVKVVAPGGKRRYAKLNPNGRAVVKLGRFAKAGKKKVRVLHIVGGERTVERITIRVRPRPGR